MRSSTSVSLVALLLLVGCASVPSGPDVLVLPGTGKSFDEFRVDDLVCRDFAFQQIGGKAREQTADNAAIRSAAIGTAIGAIAGAAMGGRDSAGVGAGMGLIVGSASGAGDTQVSVHGGQRRYDAAYVQCMYAKGHRVPVSGNYMPAPSVAAPAAIPPPPPPATVIPPPPPGNPPPPPR